MPAPLILTFAEVEFLLASCPPPVTAVRERLRLVPGGPADGVVGSGLASLLTRGLCSARPGGGVDLRPELIALAAALATSHTGTTAAGWTGDQLHVTHYFSAPSLRVGVQQGAYGRFAIEAFDASDPLSRQVNGFVDWCAADGPPSAVVVQSAADDREVSFAVAVDEADTWYLSDSADSPDRGTPTSRSMVRQRISRLLDASAAAPGPRPGV